MPPGRQSPPRKATPGRGRADRRNPGIIPRNTSSGLDLFYLVELEFDRSFAAEDGDQRADLLLLGLDLVDDAGEIKERAARYLDAIALGEVDLELRRLDAHLFEDRLHFFFLKRDGFLAGTGRADKAGDAGRVTHDVPRRVVHVHLDQNVARENFLRRDLALAVFEFDFVFHRDEHAENLVRHVHRMDAPLEIRLDLVLVTRAGVDHEPLPAVFLLGMSRWRRRWRTRGGFRGLVARGLARRSLDARLDLGDLRVVRRVLGS